MQIRLAFLILSLFALSCAPLQAIQSIDWGALDFNATKAETTPQSNARQAQPPTRPASPLIFNSVPLAVTTTAQENIYTAQGVSGNFRQAIVTAADAASKRLKLELGWSGAPRINIYIFPSRTAWLQGIGQIGGLSAYEVAFQSNLQTDAWITISGTAHPGIYLYPIQQSGFETLHMLAHEYTHAVQQQETGGRVSVPDWFLEGMAEAEGWHIAGIQFPSDYARVHADIQALVLTAAKEKRLFPLSSISTQQSWQVKLERPGSATLEYAESQMAVEYLQKIKGTNAPMNVLILTANDGDFASAFLQSTGLALSAFEAKFLSSLK